MDSAAPKRVAREAETSAPLRGLARGGYAANGVVHILIGVIAIVVAAGGDGATDQSGALMSIAAVPLGFVMLWVARDPAVCSRHLADPRGHPRRHR